MPDTKLRNAPDVSEVERSFQRALESRVRETGKYALCFIDDLAQDQAVIHVRRKGSTQTYSALLQSSRRDVQSESISDASYQQSADMFRRALRLVAQLQSSLQEESTRHSVHREGSASDFVDAANWPARDLARAILETDEVCDWERLRAFVLCAEHVVFTRAESGRIAPRLLGLALKYRDSQDAQDKSVVLSAIRTGGSMLEQNQVDQLGPLLEAGHGIETSLVAVKMIGRIFEAKPPRELDLFPDLAGRVGSIARSLLNPYAIASSQSAALAQLAVFALAGMASRGLMEVAPMLRDAGQRWFVRQTTRELQRLRDYWKRRHARRCKDAGELVARAIRAIQGNCLPCFSVIS